MNNMDKRNWIRFKYQLRDKSGKLGNRKVADFYTRFYRWEEGWNNLKNIPTDKEFEKWVADFEEFKKWIHQKAEEFNAPWLFEWCFKKFKDCRICRNVFEGKEKFEKWYNRCKSEGFRDPRNIYKKWLCV